MIQLDLTRLNFRSPYQVWEGERGYCFKTDHGIFYTVEFDPEESGLDIIAYWFNLTNNSHKSSPNDVKTRETVFCIIEEFFRVNPDILLYMCESGDGQQALICHNNLLTLADGIDPSPSNIQSVPHTRHLLSDKHKFQPLLIPS